MRNRVKILRTAAVAAIALAMGTTAFGADSLAPASSDGVDPAGMPAARHATAHTDLPSIAASVIAALSGGSNPSTTVSQSDHANAKASEHATNDHATNTSTNVTTNNDEDTDTETEDVSRGQEVGQTGTAGTRPGFGCGDTNHEHSGPPGRPGATQPPGCAKAHD